jgi:DHA2 family multidrug resistance protein
MGNATGLFNLLRNLGGSFGIATMTTLLARRSQVHQSHLVEHLTPYDLPFRDWQARLGDLFPGVGRSWKFWENPLPLEGLYQEVGRQAQMLAFCDDYWLLTLMFLALLPLVFLMRRGPELKR